MTRKGRREKGREEIRERRREGKKEERTSCIVSSVSKTKTNKQALHVSKCVIELLFLS